MYEVEENPRVRAAKAAEGGGHGAEAGGRGARLCDELMVRSGAYKLPAGLGGAEDGTGGRLQTGGEADPLLSAGDASMDLS